jgi:hypothetical protein
VKKTDYSEEAYYKRLEGDLFPLIMITKKIEELISDYEMTKTEDLWDESIGHVVRAFFFEKGMTEYIVSITPHGMIRMPHTEYPPQLSTQIHNVIVGMYAGGWIHSRSFVNTSSID